MAWSADVAIHDVPGSLPPDAVPTDVDLSTVPRVALQLLRNVNEANLVDYAAWKDWLCLTGTVRTHNGAEAVARAWNEAVATKKVAEFEIGDANANRMMPGTSWVAVDFTFTATQEEGLVAVCSGSLSLVPGEGGTWKIWLIGSMLEHFEGHGNPDEPVLTRPFDGGIEGDEEDFQVALIGAGQNGLAQAGRLQALGIKYVLLERLPAVGMSWTEKYDTVRQHTIREYNNLPFDRTWNADDDDFLTAARVTEGFQNFAKKYNLHVWTSVDVSVRSWDSKRHKWTLDVVRNDGSGKKRTVTCQHLGLALGGGVSQPNRPKLPGEENFRGDLMVTRDFKNGRKWKGKQAIVVGSGTSAHDVAQDMLDSGVSSITMIQRQKTAIYTIDWIQSTQEGLYNLKIPTGVADRISFMMPQKIGAEMFARSNKAYKKANKEYFDAIERAGFKVDMDADLIDQIFRKWGGYYIDVGASKHIAAGDIKVKSGVAITNFTEDGMVFADGTEVKADVVVVAVGYEHDYRRQVATVVGHDIAARLGEFWGLTKDGDVRGSMQESAPGLWLLAGTCMHARFWSRFIALKLQAEFLGKPLVNVYKHEATNGVVNGVH